MLSLDGYGHGGVIGIGSPESLVGILFGESWALGWRGALTDRMVLVWFLLRGRDGGHAFLQGALYDPS